MSELPPTDEHAIERHLREVATDVDEAVDRSGSWGCLLYVAGVVAAVVFLGEVMTQVGAAVVAGFVGMILFGILATSYDDWKVRRAAREFERKYPENSPARPIAERVLRELQSGGKGLPKFRDAVLDQRVRRVTTPPITEQVRDVTNALRGQSPSTVDDGPRIVTADGKSPPVGPDKPLQKATADAPRHMPLEPFEATPGPKREGEGS